MLVHGRQKKERRGADREREWGKERKKEKKKEKGERKKKISGFVRILKSRIYTRFGFLDFNLIFTKFWSYFLFLANTMLK